MNISSQQIVFGGESAGAYLAFFERLRNNSDSGNQARYKAIVNISRFCPNVPNCSGRQFLGAEPSINSKTSRPELDNSWLHIFS